MQHSILFLRPLIIGEKDSRVFCAFPADSFLPRTASQGGFLSTLTSVFVNT